MLTVLFTDIEGSTALIDRLGDDRWLSVLSAHDAAVRAAVGAFGGHEVKAVGDGFMVVFDRAADAVRGAVLAQRLVAELPVPDLPGGLRVRIGAHAGPVVRRDGDVLGRTVHVARRITSAARGGQVLVSSWVKVLADPDESLRVGPARTLRLPGVAEPEVVFEIRAGGDAAEARLHVLDPHRPHPLDTPAAAR